MSLHLPARPGFLLIGHSFFYLFSYSLSLSVPLSLLGALVYFIDFPLPVFQSHTRWVGNNIFVSMCQVLALWIHLWWGGGREISIWLLRYWNFRSVTCTHTHTSCSLTWTVTHTLKPEETDGELNHEKRFVWGRNHKTIPEITKTNLYVQAFIRHSAVIWSENSAWGQIHIEL